MMNKKSRRQILANAAMALVALCVGSSAQAQAYPNKPVTIVVPFVAGGSTDVTARAIGQKLTTQFGQQIIVDNKPGGGSTIGVAYVAKAPPDGYTLLFTTISMAINASLRPKLTYDSIKDLQPIIQISSLPLVLVINPNLPPKNFQEFIAYAKANPGTLVPSVSTINGQLSKDGLNSWLQGEAVKATVDNPKNPQETEKRIYELWEQSGFFNPDGLPCVALAKQGVALPMRPKWLRMAGQLSADLSESSKAG